MIRRFTMSTCTVQAFHGRFMVMVSARSPIIGGGQLILCHFVANSTGYLKAKDYQHMKQRDKVVDTIGRVETL